MTARAPRTIKRIYVRRYRDNGQVTAYVDWSDGSRTVHAATRATLLADLRSHYSNA